MSAKRTSVSKTDDLPDPDHCCHAYRVALATVAMTDHLDERLRKLENWRKLRSS